MNCRQTRPLISAYLDQELTGREMLDFREHIRLCPACADDLRETSEVRRLLRALLPYSPPPGAEQRLVGRIASPQAPFWSPLTSALGGMRPSLTTPLHGRRLATALTLSSIVLLAVAAPVAPPVGDASAINAGATATLPPISASLLPLPSSSWLGGAFPFLHLTSATPVISVAARSSGQDAAADFSAGDAEPLRDQAALDYMQGNVALADYRATADGTP